MRDPDHQPFDFVPAFTWARLIAVAEILVKSRRWVAEDAKPERGDTRTGVGFRAWEHAKHAITVAAATVYAEWLGVCDGGARFIFLLGGAPIRFYRGDSEEPVPDNYADPDAVEREQLQLFHATNPAAAAFEGYYRIIVQADSIGLPLAVFLVGVDFDNVIRMAWEIPTTGDATGTTPINVPQTPVPLPPLEVFTVAEVDSAAREAAKREEGEREAKRRADGNKNTESRGA